MPKPVSSHLSQGTHCGAKNQLETTSNHDTVKEINSNAIKNVF